MRLAERVIRVAARALPPARRVVRLEEWLADLDGSQELGFPSSAVPLAALRYVASIRNVASHVRGASRRARVVVALGAAALAVLAFPVSAVVGYVGERNRGAVTLIEASDGSEVVLEWREYPAVAGLKADGVLEAPTVEAGLLTGEQLLESLRAEWGTIVPLTWSSEGGEPIIQQVDNQFGGASMLSSIAAPGWQAKGASITAADAELLLAAAETLAEGSGFEVAEQLSSPAASEGDVFRSWVLRDLHGQWIALTVGVPAGSAENHPMVTMAYGAEALLHAADRQEFERRSVAYENHHQPAPFES